MLIMKLLILILVTFIPFLELRASIPLGILNSKVNLPFGLILQGFGLNWILVSFICVATNIVLGPIVYLFLDNFVHYFLKFKIFANYYHKKVEKTQEKIKFYIDKYGLLGISLFIGIPIPGTGTYSAALGSYFLGLSYKKFVLANILGTIIAGIITTIITLTSIKFFNLF